MAGSKQRKALPRRYEPDSWLKPFRDAIAPSLLAGARILDIGSGRRPAIPLHERPSGVTYVGLDLSESELASAPLGAYDQTLVGDVAQRRTDILEQFDLIVSWQVLEHVKPLDRSIQNIRDYLQPGGRFVGQLSGAFSFFGLAGRLVPHRAAAVAMHRLLDRDESSVFPTYYHRCWYSALRDIGLSWSDFSVIPMHGGAAYLSFAPGVQRLYLRYEEWTIRRDLKNLATHYLLVGVK